MAPTDKQRDSETSLSLSFARVTKAVCKKAAQLSILCGSDVCLICYPPGATAPVLWPEDRTKVREIIDRFRAAAPSKKRAKNQVAFKSGASSGEANVVEKKDNDVVDNDDKRAKIKKGKEKVVSEEAAAEREDSDGGPELRLPCPDDVRALASLAEVLDSNLKKVRDRIERLEAEGEGGPSASRALALPDNSTAAGGAASTSGVSGGQMEAAVLSRRAAACPYFNCPRHGCGDLPLPDNSTAEVEAAILSQCAAADCPCSFYIPPPGYWDLASPDV